MYTIPVWGLALGTGFEKVLPHGTRHALITKTTYDRVIMRGARGFVEAFQSHLVSRRHLDSRGGLPS